MGLKKTDLRTSWKAINDKGACNNSDFIKLYIFTGRHRWLDLNLWANGRVQSFYIFSISKHYTDPDDDESTS